jgi:PAS domain S-box-containing protein
VTRPQEAEGAATSRVTSWRRGALIIAGIYLAFASVWITFTNILIVEIGDALQILHIEFIKDTAFAGCTCVLLYVLVSRFAKQRLKIEEALRRNELRYRSLVLATAQITWRGEANGEIVEEQPTWEAFTGQTPEEYRGWGWMKAVHPDDREHLGERWRKAVAGVSRPPNERYYEIEYRVRRRDGVYRNLLARTVPVVSEGKVREWVGICYDITEEKIRDQQLRDSEERYRSLVQVAPDMILVHQDGKTIFINPAGTQMLRAPNAQAVLGMPPEALAHPDNIALVRERIARLSQGGSVPAIEQKLRRFDGTFVDVELGACSFIYQGRPAIQVVARDITARLQAQEQLRNSENRFHLLARATSDIVYDWDMETNAIWWNENMRLAFGYDGRPEEMGITFWSSLLYPEDAERVNNSLFGAVSGGKQFWSEEYRLRRADGSLAVVLDRGYIVRSGDGKPLRMIGAMMDITDRKLAEERLRDSREQLRALTAHQEKVREEERTRIAREIHDELGQALTGLKMDLSWFVARLPQQALLQEKAASMLKLIDSTVHAVRRLSTELRPAILDSLGLIPAIEWMAAEFSKRTGIQCQFDPADDELNLGPERMTALFRICQEALTNVAKYAHAKSVHITLDSDEQQITLRIKDDGRGITEEEKLGNRSFGLLGMRERARLLGGTFEIQGGAGGTTLTVAIPCPQPAETIAAYEGADHR